MPMKEFGVSAKVLLHRYRSDRWATEECDE